MTSLLVSEFKKKKKKRKKKRRDRNTYVGKNERLVLDVRSMYINGCPTYSRNS